MCRFLTWVYCVMLRFGVQLISSPRELCRADPQDSSSRPDTFILHLLPCSNQARKPAHYPEEPAQEASPLSRGTSPGSQPTIQRNQPRKPAHYPEEPAQEASPLSRGTSPGSQPIVRRKQPRKPVHRPEEAAQEASPSSGGSSPGSQFIIRRNQPRKPACSLEARLVGSQTTVSRN
ncbi:uncharacterized protein LOC126953878 isoform X2 [Macaca thibetana thibetana]|nr:uncharacterized protein LOC126953878 isoform X2 [Macaca thibetana thibetana]